MPESFESEDFERKVKRIPGVSGTKHLHVWSLDGESHVLNVYLRMTANDSREEMADAKRKVRDFFQDENFTHTSIDVSLPDDCD